MRVLLVTNYSKPWDMGRAVGKSLMRAGHSVEVFDYTIMPGSVLKSGLFNLTSVRMKVQKGSIARMNMNLACTSSKLKPDLVFVVKGESIFPETLEEIRKETGAALLNWFPDDPHLFNISSRTAACYDRVFTSGAAGIVKEYRMIGAKAESIGFAYDQDVFKPRRPDASYRSDVCFVGSCYPERAVLMDSIRGRELKIWGDGWTRQRAITKLVARKLLDPHSFRHDFFPTLGSLLKINPWPCCQGRGLYMEKASEAFSSSSINLNFHVSSPFPNSGTNMRDYEVTGAGGFLLADNVEALKENFRAGREVAVFDTAGEMLEMIDYYMENDEEREKVRKAGFRRAQSYTYDRRVKHMLSRIRH